MLSVAQLALDLKADWRRGCGEAFTRAVIDSRKVQPGDLFVALRGETTDGHRHLADAWARGAAGAVVHEDTAAPAGVHLLRVRDTLKALAEAAHARRVRLGLKVVAVTGSVGKTTTKGLLAHILAGDRRVLKSQGNYNTAIGLPLTLLELDEQHQVAVLEMGMRGRGEIAALAAIAEPDIGIITNIGLNHLELLGSQEAIAEAKAELLAGLGMRYGHAILNSDDPWTPWLRARFAGPTHLAGLAPEAEWRADDIEFQSEETRFKLCHAGTTVATRLAWPGRGALTDALLCAAAAGCLGMDMTAIAARLASVPSSGGRLKVRHVGSLRIYDDTYNASPASVQVDLEVLAKTGAKRRVAILGDMLELGDASAQAHYTVGQSAAQLGLELWAVGEEARAMARGAQEAGGATRYYTTPEELLASLPQIIRPQDAVLVKASRGMAFERIVAALEQWGGQPE